MYIDVGIEATACAHFADTIRYVHHRGLKLVQNNCGHTFSLSFHVSNSKSRFYVSLVQLGRTGVMLQ